jgi:hypothetical protein
MYSGMTIRLVGGLGRGQSATVVSYDARTRLCELSPALERPPADDGTTVYTLGASDAQIGGADGSGIGGWSLRHVTSTRGLFAGKELFDADLSAWEDPSGESGRTLGRVRDASFMFRGCAQFNSGQPDGRAAAGGAGLAHWDVSRVETMESMFDGCTRFDQPLQRGAARWTLPRLRTARRMFAGASRFDREVDALFEGETRCEDFSAMFEGASRFDRSVSRWDVSRATTMASMFERAARFDRPLAAWDVGRVRSMERMFWGASRFNGEVGSWSVHEVCSMREMFRGAARFDQPLGAWRLAEKARSRHHATETGRADLSLMFLGADAYRGGARGDL